MTVAVMTTIYGRMLSREIKGHSYVSVGNWGYAWGASNTCVHKHYCFEASDHGAKHGGRR